MTLVIMGMGMSAAGKSTVLMHLSHLHEMAYVSHDDIAEKRFGNPHDQEHRAEVAREAEDYTRQALGAGKPVVLDSTFVCVKKRRAKIEFLRKHGATRIIGLFFPIEFSEATARNVQRRFRVPFAVMEEQLRQLTDHPPSLSDGFDYVYIAEKIQEMRHIEFGKNS